MPAATWHKSDGGGADVLMGSPRYTRDIPEIQPRYTRDIPEIQPRYTGATEDVDKGRLRGEIQPRYSRDTAEIYRRD